MFRYNRLFLTIIAKLLNNCPFVLTCQNRVGKKVWRAPHRVVSAARCMLLIVFFIFISFAANASESSCRIDGLAVQQPTEYGDLIIQVQLFCKDAVSSGQDPHSAIAYAPVRLLTHLQTLQSAQKFYQIQVQTFVYPSDLILIDGLEVGLVQPLIASLKQAEMRGVTSSKTFHSVSSLLDQMSVPKTNFVSHDSKGHGADVETYDRRASFRANDSYLQFYLIQMGPFYSRSSLFPESASSRLYFIPDLEKSTKLLSQKDSQNLATFLKFYDGTLELLGESGADKAPVMIRFVQKPNHRMEVSIEN